MCSDGDGKITFDEFIGYYNGLQKLVAERKAAGLGDATDAGAGGPLSESKYAPGEAGRVEDDGDEFDLDMDGEFSAAVTGGGSLAAGSLASGSLAGAGGGSRKNIVFGGSGSGSAADAAIADYRAEHGWDEEQFSNVKEKLRSAATGGAITKDIFIEVMREYGLFRGEDRLIGGLFRAFDKSGDGSMDVEEVESGLQVFATGSKEERVRWVFAAFDEDGDAAVTKAELADMLKPYVTASLRLIQSAVDFIRDEAEAFGDDPADAEVSFRENGSGGTVVSGSEAGGGNVAVSLSTKAGNVSVELAKSALFAGSTDAFSTFKGAEMLSALVALAFDAHDKDHDGTLGCEEFVAWATSTGVVDDVISVFEK